MKQRIVLGWTFLLILPFVLGVHSLSSGGLNPNQLATLNQPVTLGFMVANNGTSQDEIVQFVINAPAANVFFKNASASGPVGFSCSPPTSTVTCVNMTEQGLSAGRFVIVNVETLVTTDGAYTFSVATTDKRGGAGAITYDLTVDSTPPSLTITSPEAKTYTAASIPVTLTAGNDAVLVWYEDGSANVTYTQSFTKSFDDGTHSFVAYAKDGLGNVRRTNVTFKVDGTLPSITITSPPGDWETRNDMVVRATVSDGNGVDAQSILYRLENSTVNGSWQALQSGTDDWSATLGIGSLAEGEYTLRVAANDTSGNMNSASVKVKKDLTAPVLSSVQVGSVTSNSGVVTWSSDEATNASLEYGISLSLGTVLASSSRVKTQSVQLTSLSASTVYYYRVMGCDLAGNCAASNVSNFTTVSQAAAPSVFEEVVNNIGATTSIKYDTLTPGSVISYPVEDVEIGLKKIVFDVRERIVQASLTVNQLKEKPSVVTTPDRAVYKYFEIVRSNIGNNDLANVKISFTVAKAWVAGQKAKQEGVRLLRYTDKWEELSTRFTGENGALLEFEANSPGFSVFAIVAQAGAAPPSLEKGAVALAGTGRGVDDANSSRFENLLEEKATRGTRLRVMLFFAVLALIGLGAYYVVPRAKVYVPQLHLPWKRFPHEHKHTPLDDEQQGKPYKPGLPGPMRRG